MRAILMKALLVVGLAVTAVTPALDAEEPLPATGLEEEVRALNTTLRQLVELLRQQLESSNATVLMQRVQLMASRIAPLERELRSARAEQSDRQTRLDDLDLSASSYRGHLEAQIELGEITDEQARTQLYQQEQLYAESKKQIEDRLWAAQQRVIDLEQSLAARHAELETWEGEIDRVLGLR